MSEREPRTQGPVRRVVPYVRLLVRPTVRELARRHAIAWLERNRPDFRGPDFTPEAEREAERWMADPRRVPDFPRDPAHMAWGYRWLMEEAPPETAENRDKKEENI